MQVDVALHPAGGGGEGDEGLTWCCREPSAGSVAEPLPVDAAFHSGCRAGSVGQPGQPGQPVLLQEAPGNRRWEPVG